MIEGIVAITTEIEAGKNCSNMEAGNILAMDSIVATVIDD
jgi:hypothetical protein